MLIIDIVVFIILTIFAEIGNRIPAGFFSTLPESQVR